MTSSAIDLEQYEATIALRTAYNDELQKALKDSEKIKVLCTLQWYFSRLMSLFKYDISSGHDIWNNAYAIKLERDNTKLSVQDNKSYDLQFLLRQMGQLDNYKTDIFTHQIIKTRREISTLEEKWYVPGKTKRLEKLKLHLNTVEELNSRQQYLLAEVSKLLKCATQFIELISDLRKKLRSCSDWIRSAENTKMMIEAQLKQQELEDKARVRIETTTLHKAKIARLNNKTRALASNLKNTIKRSSECPYCCRPLGNDPHIDHIYPINKGGLSIKENLVYVCRECNLLKGDMGLVEFISSKSYDLTTVVQHLRSLGKTI